MTSHNELQARLRRAKDAIKSSTGYFSVEYIERVTGLGLGTILDLLSDKSKFRKSLIKGSKGQDIYLVNTPFSYVKDFWHYIKHMNSLKY